MFGITNHKLFKMKKLLLNIFVLAIVNISFGQPTEGQIVALHFFKVDKDKMANYEAVMSEYYQKRAQSWIDNGCQVYWELRRIKPNSTGFSRQFNYMAVDVLPVGKNSRAGCNLEFNSGLSDGIENIMTQIHSDKERVFSTRLKYVTGYGNDTGTPAKRARIEFQRVFQMSKYINSHKDDLRDMFKKYSNRTDWHAFQRNSADAAGSREWNYMIFNAIDNSKQSNIPKKVWDNFRKKWGQDRTKLRDIRYVVQADLVTYAFSR